MQRPGIVGPELGDGSCRSVTEVPCRCDGAKAFSLWGEEDAVNDFTLYQGGEKRYVLGSREKLDQPRAHGTQPDCRFTNSKPATLNRGLGSGRSSQLRTSPTVGISSLKILAREAATAVLTPRVCFMPQSGRPHTVMCSKSAYSARASFSRNTVSA